jgi:hypothetical protein
MKDVASRTDRASFTEWIKTAFSRMVAQCIAAVAPAQERITTASPPHCAKTTRVSDSGERWSVDDTRQSGGSRTFGSRCPSHERNR